MFKPMRLVSFIVGLTLFITTILPAHAIFYPIEIVLPILSHPIYVDNANGSDANNGGVNDPVKTITKAIAYANTGTFTSYQILIAEGTYTNETFPLTVDLKDISFYGGYYNNFGDRDPSNHQTSVKGSSNTTIDIQNQSSVISGLRFYNQTASDAVIKIDNSGGSDEYITINAVEIDNASAFFGGIYVSLEFGDTININDNYIHGITSLGAAISVEGSHENALIYKNFLYDNSGFNGISAENATIYNNIITKQSGVGINVKNNSKAYNNTTVNNGKGLQVSSGTTGAVFMNNLIAYNINDAVVLGGSASHDFNAYYSNGSTPTLQTNDLACDPGLSNVNSTNTSDYELSSTSACIDEGTEVSSVTKDFFGNDRKKDGNADAVYASDPGAHESDGDTAAVPVISNFATSPNTFSPDADGTNDTTTISFDLNVNSNVIVSIYDSTDLVKQLMNEVRSSGTHNITWDGTNASNDTVAEADYTYIITAQNSEGQDEEQGTVTVNLSANQNLCAGFSDIAFNDPMCPAIEYVKNQGIFQGYPDGSFRPNDVINRVESTKVILEGFGISLLADDGTNLGFSDINLGEWYMTYLRTGKDEGIVQGYPDGTFRPNQQVVRVELLKIFMETSAEDLSSITISTAPYPDTPISTDTSWYLLYVQFSKDHALVDADSNGDFNPAEGMKRGDVAELFYRFHQEGFI